MSLVLRLWPPLRAGVLNPWLSSSLAFQTLCRGLQDHGFHFKRERNWGTAVTFPRIWDSKGLRSPLIAFSTLCNSSSQRTAQSTSFNSTLLTFLFLFFWPPWIPQPSPYHSCLSSLWALSRSGGKKLYFLVGLWEEGERQEENKEVLIWNCSAFPSIFEIIF